MQLNTIKPKKGSTHVRKNLGRGNGSGHGTFCSHGCKGTGQRQGGNVRPGFEGGQTPLVRRLPKLRGFKNPNALEFQVVNLSDLNVFKDGEEVNPLNLFQKKLVRRKGMPVKVLGDGKLERKLTLKVHAISASAKAKVLKVGGKVI